MIEKFPGWHMVLRTFIAAVPGLMVIAVIPLLVFAAWNITQFPFGGTAILITVGVALETMKQIDSQLMMRNYEGFLR